MLSFIGIYDTSPFLLGSKGESCGKERSFENKFFHHASWNVAGLDNSGALDLNLLLTKRRIDIGGFKLLEWFPGYALFAKLERESKSAVASPGDLCQYEITVGEKVHIDCYMESESGSFHPFDPSTEITSKFRRMVNNIKRRDQECGRALRSRSALLRSLQNDPEESSRDDYRTNVKRMLTYSYSRNIKIRAFHSESANAILVEMTCRLLVSGDLFGVSSVRLPTSTSEETREDDTAFWFLVTYDRETMSLIQLSQTDEEENLDRYRKLTLFTSTISDLYTKRGDLTDDLADDDSVQTHGDHECVSQFVGSLQEAYAKVFATSAYLSLRQQSEGDSAILTKEDIEEAIETCVFVEVSNVLVVGNSLFTPQFSPGESKLLQLIKTILRPVPGDLPYFFFVEGPTKSSIPDGNSNDNELLPPEGGPESSASWKFNPPIFVRFKLDGEVASPNDLNLISKSIVLAVEVSLFPSSQDDNSSMFLPPEHQSFALQISVLLKSFVAEQTLERLLGGSMSDENLSLVRKCLEKSLTTLILSIEVFFYSSKQDMMVPASCQSGRDTSWDKPYTVLETEICNNNSHFRLIKGSGGNFFVLSPCDGEETTQDEYWVRIAIDRISGKIVCQIFHPDGVETEQLLSDELDGMLQGCLHRTNQRLLLER